MKTFAFRLATLLKLRAVERDQRRGELADAERALAMIDEKLAELELDMQSARQAIRRAANVGEVMVDALLDNQRYELMLMAEKKSIDAQRKQVAVEAERRRGVLVEADRQVKTLEKLRESQFEKHRAALQLHEAKQMDEVAVRAFAVRAAEL